MYTIAFCIDNMDGTYPESLWTGTLEKAAEIGVNLIMIPGGSFNPESDSDFQESLMYKLLQSPRIDGFVIVGTVFTKYRTSKWVYDYFNQYNKPYASIGLDLFTVPSSLIDNTEGLNKLFDHFFGDHGYRRVAFIRGPVNNDEAEVRFRCYRDALKKYNIEYDEKLTAVGNFNQPSGEKAMESILAAAGSPPEAVVAANDYMAIGAFDVLKRNNLNVPQDCAVGGFDNIFEAGFIESPLTTVMQPFQAQAGAALEMLVEILDGNSSQRNRLNHTELMIRNSCGCLSRTIQTVSDVDRTILEWADINPEKILSLFPKELENDFDMESICKDIAKLFLDDEYDRNLEDRVLHGFERIFSILISHGVPMYQWTQNLTRLYKMVAYSKNSLTRQESEFFQKLRILVAEYGQRAMVIEKNVMSEHFSVLRTVLLKLVSSFNSEILTKNIGESLPGLGFPSFFITRYESDKKLSDEDSVVLPENSILQLAYYQETNELKDAEVPYKTRDILPEGFFPANRSIVYLVRPLFFEDIHFGLMLTEMGPRNMMIHESIRNQISSALKAAQTYSENKRREQAAVVKRDEIEKHIEPIVVSLRDVAKLANDRTSIMRELSNSAQESSKVMEESRVVISRMNESAKAIQGMINGVLDISEQIHLLSINTSIEATKAGTQGRGFAVIAQEIKKLAHATAENVESIEKTLETFVKSIGQSQKVSEESSESYKNMINDVEQAAESLETISGQMEVLTEKSRSIIEIMKD